MNDTTYKIGDKVRFFPGPRATQTVDATVTGRSGAFLTTKGAGGKERKVRPGSIIGRAD